MCKTSIAVEQVTEVKLLFLFLLKGSSESEKEVTLRVLKSKKRLSLKLSWYLKKIDGMYLLLCLLGVKMNVSHAHEARFLYLLGVF